MNLHPAKITPRVAASLAGAILLVALMVGGSVRAFKQIETAAAARRHSYDLVTRADILLSALKDAETGERGFLLTGDEIYLQPYLAVRDGIRGKLDVLRELTLITDAHKSLDTMVPLVAAKLDEMARVIALRRGNDTAAAIALESGHGGKPLMDSIRTQTDEYIRIEEVARVRHEEEFTSNMRELLFTIVAASILTLLLALLCVYLIYRETQYRLANLVQLETQHLLESQAKTSTDESGARIVEAIRASELRYRRLFETAQDGILILDAGTGQVVDANPFMKDLLGYSQKEFLGRKLWEIGPFKGEAASRSAFTELQVNDRLHYEGLPLETKDGRRVEVEFISNAYMVGETRLIQCNIRDITERMRVNLALENSNKELAFECKERGKRADELVVINLERTDVNLALKTAVKELAFECEEKGKRADELALINEERLAANKELAYQVEEKGKRADELALINEERLAANKELAYQVEEKGKRADELALINEERLAANKELAYQVEEKGKRADELIAINAELARSNSELEQFAYVATHDLQEPLRAVASCVQLLQKRYEGQLDERADEFITHAVDGTKRMQTLINDLLAYSRISTHATPFESTDCDEVIGEALANLTVSMEESGAVLTRDRLPVVSGDSTQLTQLFQNLIGNALKFRGENPPMIHVGATLAEGEWTFSVADNGIGMEPQYFERVFQVFQRLHTRKKYLGTGIGLAICKKVVERHGGRIWAGSEPGMGATFSFTIPETK